MQLKEVMRKGMINLKTNNIKEPNLKSRLLMQYILNKPREYILVHYDQQLTLRQNVDYLKGINMLIKGIPIQHITHQQEFMKMSFYVDENVLIPRPDTEILVEEVISLCKRKNFIKILDLCTGSGAIAVSLAKYLNNVDITAVDISNKALKIAKKNARNNNVEEKITFIESDLFSNLSKNKYDLIVSNPPYIKKEDIKKLDVEVKKEPILALDGGVDGLDFYRKIILNSYNYLNNKGMLCLEIGFDQKEQVEKLLEKEGKYINIYCKKDLGNNDRVIVACRVPKGAKGDVPLIPKIRDKGDRP